jgi:hypothetical protein
VSGGLAARLFVPAFWGAVAIVTMWLAVLFDGVFGGDMVFSSPPDVKTIPSAVLVAQAPSSVMTACSCRWSRAAPGGSLT